MSVAFGPHIARIWTDALVLPPSTDLLESLVRELAAYLDKPYDDTLAAVVKAWNGRAESMDAAFPRAQDPEALADYYDTQVDGLLTSTYWHSLVPDRYALHSVSGLRCVEQFASGGDIFEFGHGIGSTAILFSQHGMSVTAGDVSSTYRDYASHRVVTRALPVNFLDLRSEEPPSAGFDAIVSFDVLEHLPNPLEEIARMREWLRPSGLLVLNIAFGRDPDTPEHIQPYRLGVLDRIRGLGFERVPWPGLYVFWKRPVSRFRRALYRVQDVAVAGREDLTSAVPALTRVVAASGLPPLDEAT